MDFIFKLHALFRSLYKDLLTVILKKQFRTIFSQAWYRSLGLLKMDAELEMEVQVAYLESRKGGCKAAWGIGEIKVQSRLDIALAPSSEEILEQILPVRVDMHQTERARP